MEDPSNLSWLARCLLVWIGTDAACFSGFFQGQCRTACSRDYRVKTLALCILPITVFLFLIQDDWNKVRNVSNDQSKQRGIKSWLTSPELERDLKGLVQYQRR
jgi:hypothetical protein